MTSVLPNRFAVRQALAWALTCLCCAGAWAAGPGEKMYQEFLEKDQLYADEEWQAYVDEIGQRLLAVSEDAGEEYHFYVLDNPAVNAFALPDGYIFINRGLIAYLRSEDELAGVIGHEIGHVVGQHARRGNQMAALSRIAGFIGAVMTGAGQLYDLSNTAAATLRSGYGREFELEADAYGAEFLAAAGYNPMAMIDTLHVLKDHSLYARNVQKQPAVYHGLFSSHPKNDRRLYEAVQLSQGKVTPVLRETERDFWEMIDGLVFGDEAATGLIKGSSYYNGGLRVVFSFPDGWTVNNTAAEVIGRAPQGSSGAFISAQRLNPPESEQTPEEYLKDTLKRDDVSDGESREINGYPAYVGSIDVADGSARQRRIAIIFKDGGVYLFKGEVGPSGSEEQFEADWEATLASFRAMTAEDLRDANDQRIRVRIARPEDTYANLAQQVSIKGHPEETLRVINGHHPVGEPRAGDPIKIVQ